MSIKTAQFSLGSTHPTPPAVCLFPRRLSTPHPTFLLPFGQVRRRVYRCLDREEAAVAGRSSMVDAGRKQADGGDGSGGGGGDNGKGVVKVKLELEKARGKEAEEQEEEGMGWLREHLSEALSRSGMAVVARTLRAIERWAGIKSRMSGDGDTVQYSTVQLYAE